MSWNFAVTAKPLDELEDALTDANSKAQTFGSDSEESKNQRAQAIESALALAESGFIGSKDKKFNVTLSGHANPNHEPASGMSNDSITVTVTQSS